MVINYKNILNTLKKAIIGTIGSDTRLLINKGDKIIGVSTNEIHNRIYIGNLQFIGLKVGNIEAYFKTKEESFIFQDNTEDKLGREISERLVNLSRNQIQTLNSIMDAIEKNSNNTAIRRYIEEMQSLLGIEYILKSGSKSIVQVVGTFIYTGDDQEVINADPMARKDRDIDNILNKMTLYMFESTMRIAM